MPKSKSHSTSNDEEEHVPLRDPEEGTPPAVIEQPAPAVVEANQPRPIIGVRGEPIEDGERDPDTIAEEQRRRSDEMEEKGFTAWMEAHDERTPGQAPQAVEGTYLPPSEPAKAS